MAGCSAVLLLSCTKPSDRYQGISEPRESHAEQSPATLPSLPAKGPPGAIANARHDSAVRSEDTDGMGTSTPTAANGVKATTRPETTDRPDHPRQERRAELRLKTAPGSRLRAQATLEEVEAGVHVEVSVEDARPGGRGVHIHARPDCSDIRGKSMGDHFAPRGHAHGLEGAQEHHLGDLGNLYVDKNGDGELELTVPRASLANDDPLSFANRAIVVHEGEDHGARAQPSGDSGKPVACAVIRVDGS
jgi:superoxide dismutase, Cu-Zn family